ncbi:hypothetical protein K7432_003851 [Basidiobolus ranarum]|uniref:Uncharacterized protein n=1 Tax=Basidiobolus ranarum TaxID=34480 RepID=A0ABR2WZ67_9FUNG
MKPYLPLATRLSSLPRIEFCKYTTDLSTCTSDSASLFQRYPKLENASFKSLQSNSFKWAVERRDLYINSGTVSDSKPPPLQYVDISCQHCAALPIVQDINRICYRFNFGSLEYSPLLETIDLLETGTSLPIRPLHAPCWTWTWDWKLPRLKKLSLVGESAVLFQFHLLDSCPLQDYLGLNNGRYRRTLALNEILRTDLSTEYVSQIVPRNEINHKCK